MTDLSVIQDSTLDSLLDNCTESSDISPEWITVVDLDLKKGETPVYFRGITGEKRFYRAINQMSLADTFRMQKEFLIKAYHNKDTIINYLKLYNSLIENEITDDDFDKEINDNPKNYFVYINRKINVVEMEALSELVKELGEDLSIQDVSETFSVDLSNIINYVNASKSLPNG